MQPTPWQERRSDFRYRGVSFSPDGRQLLQQGQVYREIPFSQQQGRSFKLWLGFALAIFVLIPLLAWAGWQDLIPWVAIPYVILLYYLHGRIHRCPGCGGRSRKLTTPFLNAPVLYLCPRCHTFFEHGEVDGGWPWR